MAPVKHRAKAPAPIVCGCKKSANDCDTTPLNRCLWFIRGLSNGRRMTPNFGRGRRR